MSYIATRGDIRNRWDKFWRASEELGEVLKDVEHNPNFTQSQVLQCRYLEAQLKADRYRLWEYIMKFWKENI